MRRSYKHMINTEWRDSGGYWIELKSGFQDIYNPTCHTIVENTKAEAHSKAKDAAPCDCKDCRIDKARRKAELASLKPKAQEHAEADARCGRPWQCACGTCRVVREATA